MIWATVMGPAMERIFRDILPREKSFCAKSPHLPFRKNSHMSISLFPFLGNTNNQ